MRYVVQMRWFLFWEVAGGDDWIGWNDTLEQAEAEVRELERADANNRRRDVVIAVSGEEGA
jgi:hypothetical protein